MRDSFRLLRVIRRREQNDLFPRDADSGKSDFVFADARGSSGDKFSHADQSSNWMSIVIGKNGVGKSRLLSDLAFFFDTLREKPASINFNYVEYTCSGRHCRVERDPWDYIEVTIDGRPAHPSDLPLPSRVAAVTITPFDKFRLPAVKKEMAYTYSQPSAIQERYHYLGLRDRTGRSSPTSIIQRALERLFDASESPKERRVGVAEMFHFLGYLPQIQATYEASGTSRAKLEAIASGQALESALGLSQSKTMERQIEYLLHRDLFFRNEIYSAARSFVKRMDGSHQISLTAHFDSASDDRSAFYEAQLLKKAGFLRLHRAQIVRAKDHVLVDLKSASSGELSIVTTILGLAAVLEDGSLILVDEPEISLHPEWQTTYIDLLRRIFHQYTGSHFIVATHSPLILSDATQDTTLVSLDNDIVRQEASTFSDESVDFILATAFRTPGKNNSYLKNQIIKALRLAAAGKALSDEFAEIANEMAELQPKLDQESHLAKLMKQLILAPEVVNK